MPRDPTLAEPVNKWAVLIGINDYGDGKRHTKKRYDYNGREIEFGNLRGCVNDVLEVEKYLVETLQVPPENIEKLVTPCPKHPNDGRLSEGSECCQKKPTYENIVESLRNVAKSVRERDSGLPKRKKGDLVYIHYSGHGARATTVFSKWRAIATGLRKTTALPGTVDKEDHALVPCDILDGGRFLRDLEIAILLHAMVEEGLLLTVVLDCCHSGGAHRSQDKPTGDSDERVRGIEEVVVSTPEDELEDTEEIKRWAENPYWLYQPKGFVLLAACQELQKAKEISGRGVFTTCLLEILRSAPLGLSSQALSDSVSHKVHKDKVDRDNFSHHMLSQTPLLRGDVDRCFFNKTLQARVYGFAVVHKDMKAYQIRLNGGLIHGVRRNSLYNILPRGPRLGAEEIEVLAQVQVNQVWGGQSLARLTTPEQPSRWEEIVEGCSAVMQSLPEQERFAVRFGAENPLRDRCEELWRDRYGSNAWLALKDDDAVTFEISIDDAGCFAIGGQLGEVTTIMGKALPPLSIAEEDLARSMAHLVHILEHLAQYKMFKDVASHEVVPKPSELVDVEVHPAPQAKIFNGELLHPVLNMELDKNTGLYQAEERRLFQFKVRNRLDRKVHFVVFSCSAEFSIEKLYPADGPYKTLTSKGNSNNMEEDSVDLGAAIADELRQATDNSWNAVETYKIFASVRANDLVRLNSLTLAALSELDLSQSQGEQTLPLAIQSAPQDLKEYFSFVGQDLDSEELRATLIPRSVKQEPAEWQTKDIRVKVTRPQVSGAPQQTF